MEKLNIAQNESLCYFKQLFPMERILDLNFKNVGLVSALPLSTNVIMGKLFHLLRTQFIHLRNGNTGTSQHGLGSPGACCTPPSPQSVRYLHVWVKSDPSLVGDSLRVGICLFCLHRIPRTWQITDLQ